MVTSAQRGVTASFWKGKRVFLTGHTGFKGSWLSLWLQEMGAKVTGFALAPNTQPNLFEAADVASGMTSIIGDVRNLSALQEAMHACKPEIVLHLAAQPLVRLSYNDPVSTLETNIMGTVNLLEAVRNQPQVQAMVVVTSDKCYENREIIWGYRENEPMGGHDPYSSSKACAELVSHAYRQCFLSPHGVALATARAGNVIGGGDWSADRLVPDILRAIDAQTDLVVRNPKATRPWQHVLEPLAGYLMLAERLYHKNEGQAFASGWNFGPSTDDIRPVDYIVERLGTFCRQPLQCKPAVGAQPHEAHLLALDSTKARLNLGWHPRWPLSVALEKIAAWHQAFMQGEAMRAFSCQQIRDYQSTPPTTTTPLERKSVQ